ncbi:MAG: hypothetical protein P3M73_00120 [Candidatus Hodgkinia cicadicola]|nr:MAG: hypothetical protein P3M73_00120 [Candidatus Hodgkinia cicadicola]
MLRRNELLGIETAKDTKCKFKKLGKLLVLSVQITGRCRIQQKPNARTKQTQKKVLKPCITFCKTKLAKATSLAVLRIS